MRGPHGVVRSSRPGCVEALALAGIRHPSNSLPVEKPLKTAIKCSSRTKFNTRKIGYIPVPRKGLNLQGRRDLNSQPSVLETGALPIELLPFATPEGVGEPASLPEAATRPEAECSIRQPAAPFSVGGQVQAEAAAGRDRRDRAAINTPPVTPAAVAATIPPT